MTSLRSLVIGLVIVSGTAMVGVLTTSAPADAQNPHPGSAPVNIVSSVPLDVTGSVALLPGGSVTIANAPTSPVPVYNVEAVAKEPFQAGSISTAFNNSSSSADLITVPAGKRLVIEHFSAWINASGPDGLAAVSLGVENSGQFDQPLCQQIGQTANGLNHFFSCSMQTRFYANAGETVKFFVSVANSDGGFHRAFVSGYYVPVP